MRYQELFEAEELQKEIKLFADQTKKGLDLKEFNLGMIRGDIKLYMFIIKKEDRKRGLGSEAMDRLTKFADQHGKRIILSPLDKDKHHGTTSRSRLIKFYKRFGFYENKGKDFSISETMIRDPKLFEFSLVKAYKKRSKEKEMLKKHGPVWRRSIERLNKDLEDPHRILSKAVRRQLTTVLRDKNKLVQELNEKVENVDGITVLINPSINVLKKFIKDTGLNEVRVLFDNKNFYFWEAAQLIHGFMAPRLGIEWYTRLVINYRITRGDERFRVELLDPTHEEIWNHPYYKKLIDLDYRKIASVLEESERLNEKVEMIDGIKVLINPGIEILRKFIIHSIHGSVRGLFDGKQFYFWDANQIIHDHMAPKLGLEYYFRLDLWRNKDGSFNIDSLGGIIFNGMERMVPEVKQHPYYLKLRGLI